MSMIQPGIPTMGSMRRGISGFKNILNVKNLGIGGVASIAWALISGNTSLPEWALASMEGYRPSQWGFANASQLVYCKTNIGGLFFDAVLHSNINHSAEITSHPVQAGANLSDHMYMEPVQLSMEIGMSDAMASMIPGQWSGAYSKSVSAYRALVELQAARIPITVLTRLDRYENMVIKSIDVDDGPETLNGLRANVSLQQVIVGSVTTEKVSARGWSSAGAGRPQEVQPETPTSAIGSMDPNGTTRKGEG